LSILGCVMRSKGARLYKQVVVAVILGVCLGVPTASIAAPPPTPIVDPGPPLSSDEQQTYGRRSPVEICFNPDVTIRDIQAVQQLKLDCDNYKKKNGFLSFGIYGYNHPAPTFCNSGNGMRTGLLGFLTGSSIGNKNLITGIGTFLGVLFAGCNNAPPAPLGSISGANVQPAAPPPSPIVVSQATLSVSATQDATLLVSEPGSTGPFTAKSDNVSIIVDPLTPKTADSPGAQVKFTIKLAPGAQNIKANVTVTDGNSQKSVVVTSQ
jgi:hypothetical protein